MPDLPNTIRRLRERHSLRLHDPWRFFPILLRPCRVAILIATEGAAPVRSTFRSCCASARRDGTRVGSDRVALCRAAVDLLGRAGALAIDAVVPGRAPHRSVVARTAGNGSRGVPRPRRDDVHRSRHRRRPRRPDLCRGAGIPDRFGRGRGNAEEMDLCELVHHHLDRTLDLIADDLAATGDRLRRLGREFKDDWDETAGEAPGLPVLESGRRVALMPRPRIATGHGLPVVRFATMEGLPVRHSRAALPPGPRNPRGDADGLVARDDR